VASETVCTFLTYFFKIRKHDLFTFFELLCTFSRTLLRNIAALLLQDEIQRTALGIDYYCSL